MFSTGSRAIGDIIPANSALVFETELIHLDAKAGKDEL
jgi:FKBP-type peptidyl-prolyl cis-trans isomerase